MEYVDLVTPYWKQGLGMVSMHVHRPEPEVELIVLTVLATLTTILLLRLGGRILFRKPKKCCARDLVKETKVEIPNNDNALIAEIQNQLVLIHKEIVNLKHERELVDTELIETSTQILQTIAASFGQSDEYSREELETTIPKMEVPVPQRIQMMQSPATFREQSPPEQRILPISEGTSQPLQQEQSPRRVPEMAQTKIDPPQQVPVRESPRMVPQMAAPPKVAAPKMSAIAAARMKREAEMASSAPAAPSGSTNPFGKPRAAPFGAQMS